MAEVIRMPRMSDTMTEGNIVGWLKEEGEAVEPGDTLAEVETDKATMELDSFTEGILLHIAVKEGTVPINGVIAVVGDEGEDWKAAIEADEQSNGGGASQEAAPAMAMAESHSTAHSSTPAPTVDIVEASPATAESRVKASPLAKSMAADAGISLANVQGSGDNGRIVKKDVEAMLKSGSTGAAMPASSPAPASAPAAKDAPAVEPFVYGGGGENNFEEIPVTQMRKVIARRLGESKFTCLLYTSPSPRDATLSRMPSSA